MTLTDAAALRTGLLSLPYLDKLQHANADDLAFWVLGICGAVIPWFSALWFVTTYLDLSGGSVGIAFGVGAVLTGMGAWFWFHRDGRPA